MRRLWIFLACLSCALGGSAGARAADAPEALTLQAALAAPLQDQYTILRAEAELARARAIQAQVLSWYDPVVTVTGQLRAIRPSRVAPDPDNHADNAIGISARQQLFDFGRQTNRDAAAAEQLRGAELNLAAQTQRQKLAILKAFFAVLLADQTDTVANEHMAVVYVRFDKTKDRRELGMVSADDLAKAQIEYENALYARSEADSNRRTSRRILAELLGTPNALPGKLVSPTLDALFARSPPELAEAIQRSLRDDPTLQSLKAQYAAAVHRVEVARDHNMPNIYAEVNAEEYQRALGSRDPLRAGIYLSVPLYDGRLRDAELGRAQADRMQLAAAIAERESYLRESCTAVLERIALYRKAGLSRAKAQADYADLNFTRKQTLYQMEKATDLGDAMVEESAATLLRLRNTLALATAWAELLEMQNQPLDRLFLSDSSEPAP
ncbi:TolC family protein [Halothiobacillus sp. DCM-1]|uniref:TolC family protein n=1 Tax=Halothiobacillus sp. DCM-1 TaxID=3112558 RepID=UPI003246C5ED